MYNKFINILKLALNFPAFTLKSKLMRKFKRIFLYLWIKKRFYNYDENDTCKLYNNTYHRYNIS